MVRWDRRTAVWAKLTEKSVAVMNYTEMEAKVNQFLCPGGGGVWANGRTQVREATNNEPWGASSTLMQEISNATNS